MVQHTLDLTGIPEPIVRGLEVVAEQARKLTGQTNNDDVERSRVELPIWNMKLHGEVTRQDIYDDYTGRV